MVHFSPTFNLIKLARFGNLQFKGQILSNVTQTLIRSSRTEEAEVYLQQLKKDFELVPDMEDIYKSRMTIELVIVTVSKDGGDLRLVDRKLRSAIKYQEEHNRLYIQLRASRHVKPRIPPGFQQGNRAVRDIPRFMKCRLNDYRPATSTL